MGLFPCSSHLHWRSQVLSILCNLWGGQTAHKSSESSKSANHRRDNASTGGVNSVFRRLPIQDLLENYRYSLTGNGRECPTARGRQTAFRESTARPQLENRSSISADGIERRKGVARCSEGGISCRGARVAASTNEVTNPSV